MTSLTHPIDKPQGGLRPVLAATFGALWYADIATTVTFVTMFGAEAEANALMRWLIETHGLPVFALVKLLILLLWFRMCPRVATWIQVVLICVMIPVVGLNLLTIFS